MLAALATDLWIAIRTLLKARGFTGAVIVTLGLGLTLSVAVLAILNAYLIRSLPYPAASRMYSVRYAPPGEQSPRGMEALDWRALEDVIEHPVAWDLDMFYLIGGEQAESAPGAWVTPGFVQALGIQPAIGRGFDDDAFAEGSSNVALIGHRFWQRRFGGDLQIVGRRFDAYVSDRPDEAESFTIIGVLPESFWHVNTYTDILAPLRAPTYPYMVRLHRGVAPEAAAWRITALVRGGVPGLREDWHVDLVPVHEQYVMGVRPILRAVSIAAALVLLIAWANVAGLLLIRAAHRQQEMAVRVALGAGRLAIARLLILEALVLGGAASAVGLVVSGLTLRWLAPIIERELGRPAPGGLAAFAPDGTVLVLAAACGLLTAGVCAIAPLVASSRELAARGLHSGSRTTEGRGSRRARSVLIALEVAASVALLAGSTLMVRSVRELLQVDFGIDAERVLTVPVMLRQRTYPDTGTRGAFLERSLESLQAIPGVASAAAGNWWPLQSPRPQTVAADDAQGDRAVAGVLAVTPEYFSALGIPLTAGRVFVGADGPGSEPVAVVSQTLARRLWPDRQAVGRRVGVGAGEGDQRQPPTTRLVIGVVRDVRQTPDDESLADLYIPLLEAPGRFAWVHVRTSGPPIAWLPAVRSVFKEVDPDIPLTSARPLRSSIDQQLSRPKFLASLLTGFALVAATLALVGLYGVIAYAVKQREKEIAIRMAVGADGRAITRLFVGRGAVVLLGGLGLGVLGAAAAGRMLESQLFGVRPGDPATLAITAAGFTAVSLFALWWPARRAAATDPAAVLKQE